jgi:hypothetical protein
MSANPQPPPFHWHQLTPAQQTRLAHLLARLLEPQIQIKRLQKKEARHEQSPQNL